MKARRGERGQALLLAVLALGFGMLVITPFLANASETLLGSGVYAAGIRDQYAGDAGIEYAAWGLLNGTWTVAGNATLDVPPFSLNGRDVRVSISSLGAGVYDLKSLAADGTGHVAAVVSLFRLGGWSSAGNVTGDVTGDVFITGDVVVDGGVTIDGNLYTTGNVTMGNNARVTGNVVAGGDLDLSNNGVIGGDVAVGGALTLGNNSSVGSLEVGGNLCAAGDIVLLNNVTVYGSVSTGGYLELHGSSVIEGDVFTGAATAYIALYNTSLIGGSVYVGGGLADRLELANNAGIDGAVYALGSIAQVIRAQNVLGGVFQQYAGSFPAGPT